MMKADFQGMLSFIEQRLAAKRRGYDLFFKELLSNLIHAFDDDAVTVYVSGYAFPTELLWAFDVVPFDFEIACNNLPAAAGGNGSAIMSTAEAKGFSRDVCSFDRLIVGCDLQGLLPRGALYLTSSYYCHGKAKANEIVAQHAGQESVLFDVPNKFTASSLRYVVSQLKDIAARLESVTGQRLDLDRLKDSIRRSNRARASLLEINDLMKHRPCPWDGVRACQLSLAGAVFWGSTVRETIHQALLEEVRARVEAGSSLPERNRILWYPWAPVQPTNTFSILRENQVSVPMAEAAYVWWSELDEDQPFEALARKALEDYLVGPASRRVGNLVKMAEEFQVDGAIHFGTPACYQETAAFRLTSDALKESGVPVLDLDGDMTDERSYSPERTAAKLASFLELMEAA
jgi:benzoyl-CoA reductase/2-hydroxyglutaryl-CoA dehydratase subunit BcrC/BadD/HgdB